MKTSRPRGGVTPARRMAIRRFELPVEGGLRLVVVADTHGRPHPGAAALIRGELPAVIVHAGDVGAPAVLDELAAIAPLLAVRGNVDGRSSALPELIKLELYSVAGDLRLTALVVHIATSGPRLLADTRRLAFEQRVQLVVCGHSHLPWLGLDGDVAVFNPGSIGPRRFSLPITYGVIDVSPGGVDLRHVDCETGRRWLPGAG